MSGRLRLIILVSLIILVLVTISVHSDPRRPPSLVQKALLEVVATTQRWLTSSADGLEHLWLRYLYLVGLRQENQELRRALDRSKAQIVTLKENGLAYQRLTKLLKFSKEGPHPSLGARVIGWGPRPWFKTATIDRGSIDGVAVDMPIINEQGLVGRVVEVSPRFARILLITDFNSSVDAMIQRSRARGIMQGGSENICGLKYVHTKEDVIWGDTVVTSGLGALFPRGILLGTVTRVKKAGYDMFQDIEITPSVDFDHLEELLVILTTPPSL
ncbi:MAG: rod shape-determining protein MreC [Deltaproteobacteria bacterium]|nr:rod shape-determining protein MreC [Deltaproteobacteria bacterium]